MQSSTEGGPVPDRTREHPSTKSSSITTTAPPHFSDSNTPQRPIPTADAVSEQSWKPKFDRRQSWNHEDQKHELQERLLNMEQGRETGFSETGTDP
ncbi:hypothetical protein POX_a00775 [Penicillium oxalicum]|uniref:Uncharacterized protein n=1 Tax=Penicillium oxalicum (strain 114-2 / CGMCC 5302) TaxID=933388 RepID=S7ZZH4_PENO1|nr:hypothetical protein POX_a00775 [Penicillium oxalicum]EPS34251.1 hypothetical protein PDE_09215 [Penicillium oxalicum 114-2]KAI2794185.1 hypothetical protein POX_a00775 [Penicillium oxalicum]